MITREDVLSRLSYDGETGEFTWRIRPAKSITAGSKAGYRSHRGYIQIGLMGKMYLAHRLAWLYVHGEWTPHDTDHINGDKSDNRIANLRPAYRFQNEGNKPRNALNTSGVKGVSWCSFGHKWRACIKVDGKTRQLGRFGRIEDAAEAYRAAAWKHFGEFARTE